MKFEKDDIKIIILAAVGAFIGLGIYHLLFPPDKPPEPEDEAYHKAMAPSGTVADCKNFLNIYPHDDNNPNRKYYRQEVGTKLVAFAKDTALDTTSRITACNTYLNHFGRGDNSTAIKNIKNDLTSKSTQNTNAEAGTKTVIDSYDKLFEIAQNYNNVNMGWPSFQKRYEIKRSYDLESKNLENMAHRLCNAILGINKSKYDHAYQTANNNKSNAKEKLEILISNLKELRT